MDPKEESDQASHVSSCDVLILYSMELSIVFSSIASSEHHVGWFGKVGLKISAYEEAQDSKLSTGFVKRCGNL